jgi:phosphocarrier protein
MTNKDKPDPSGDSPLEKKFVIKNKLGLHARPAAVFVQLANKFQSEIIIRKGRQKVNGKSIMGLMTLAAGPGSQVVVTVQGLDAKKAMAGIEELFAKNFGE